MTLQKCVCDCDICNPDYKIGDIVEFKNQWNINDIGIIVNINEELVIVSMKKFKGDYSIFNINNSKNVKKKDLVKQQKEELLSHFDKWWFDVHKNIII